jgi:hypothetical protein
MVQPKTIADLFMPEVVEAALEGDMAQVSTLLNGLESMVRQVTLEKVIKLADEYDSQKRLLGSLNNMEL